MEEYSEYEKKIIERNRKYREEFNAEQDRKIQEAHQKRLAEIERLDKERIERERKEKERLFADMKANPLKYRKKRYDHPNSLDNDEATIVWIVGMIVSLFFKGGWTMCILLSIIWFNYISRHWD